MGNITVTNAGDSGPGSLREAVKTANLGTDPVTIRFDPSLRGKTIVLTSGEIEITQQISIDGELDGDGLPDITISGNGASRVFSVLAPGFELRGVSIVRGSAAEGGGIYVQDADSVTIESCSFANNEAKTGRGGGIYMTSSSYSMLSIISSSFTGNSALDGGALYSTNASVERSTFWGNRARRNIGAIGVNGDLSLTSSTISGNSAAGAIGGVWVGGSSFAFNLEHSTIADNVASTRTSGSQIAIGLGGVQWNVDHTIISGSKTNSPLVSIDPSSTSSFTSLGWNLLQDNTGVAAQFPAPAKPGGYNTNKDLVGTAASPLDPRLSALASNDGFTPTRAIDLSSPAYNAGDPTAIAGGSVPPTDQRLYPRVQYERIDIGSFEVVAPPSRGPSASASVSRSKAPISSTSRQPAASPIVGASQPGMPPSGGGSIAGSTSIQASSASSASSASTASSTTSASTSGGRSTTGRQSSSTGGSKATETETPKKTKARSTTTGDRESRSRTTSVPGSTTGRESSSASKTFDSFLLWSLVKGASNLVQRWLPSRPLPSLEQQQSIAECRSKLRSCIQRFEVLEELHHRPQEEEDLLRIQLQRDIEDVDEVINTVLQSSTTSKFTDLLDEVQEQLEVLEASLQEWEEDLLEPSAALMTLALEELTQPKPQKSTTKSASICSFASLSSTPASVQSNFCPAIGK